MLYPNHFCIRAVHPCFPRMGMLVIDVHGADWNLDFLFGVLRMVWTIGPERILNHEVADNTPIFARFQAAWVSCLAFAPTVEPACSATI